MLMTAYAAGLRLSEVTHLQVSDIDSEPNGDSGTAGQGPEGSLRDARRRSY